jgi:hypothetical protein
MLYNQPYGVTDPNAPYINGNPSTGTMGSIPPAASIEYPQREIVNFETDSGLTPTNTDLHQLSKAVQSGVVNYAVDSGLVNNVAVTLNPVPNIIAGLTIRVKMLFAPTGASQINVNATGNKNITKSGGAPLVGQEWQPGDVVIMTYDGIEWQLIGFLSGQLVKLIAATDYYVDPVNGNDANLGTSAGAGHAWATLNHAYLWLQQNINANGQTITIHCAFPAAPTAYAPFSPVGGITGVFSPGQVQIVGDVSGWNCQITTAANNVSCVNATYSVQLTISGFRFVSTGTLSAGVTAVAGARLNIRNCGFGVCAGYCVQASGSGSIIDLSATAVSFLGNCLASMQCSQGALIIAGGTTFTYGGITCSVATVAAIDVAKLILAQNTFAGSGVTGSRFSLTTNSILDTNGSQGLPNTAYIPGTTAGTTATGGQFQ